MTKAYYILSDGTRVETYAKALASGQTYKVCYEPIKEKVNFFIPKCGDMRIKL